MKHYFLIFLVIFCNSILFSQNAENISVGKAVFNTNSVLSTGNWYKIGILNDGIYKIDYSFLTSAGINPLLLDVNKIGLFSGNIEMLSEKNSDFRIDDLIEISIYQKGLEDGRFDENDQILFFGKGPTSWNYDSINKMWLHKLNIYSDSVFYFFTPDKGSLKNITQYNENQNFSEVITDFEYRDFIEDEIINLGSTGKQWYGDLFDLTTERTYKFNIPQRSNSTIKLKTKLIASSSPTSSFDISNTSANVQNVLITGLGYGYGVNFGKSNFAFSEINSNQNPFEWKITYNKPLIESKGYLDAIDINAFCDLIYDSKALFFRNHSAIKSNTIAKYEIKNSKPNLKIWDITNPYSVIEVKINLGQNNLATFNANISSIKEYVAFEEKNATKPVSINKIENQNLHGMQSSEYIIISHKDFFPQAVRLATFHSSFSELHSTVVEISQIYNEFSGGKQDVSAIRDFIRMLYDRRNSNIKPNYLLLFGDASYDYKNRLSNNTNYVPTHETEESLDPINSIASDDFFGYLDADEGNNVNEIIDIGIGRLPVYSLEEAEKIVDKIIMYQNNDTNTMQNWRNTVAFVADDEENNNLIFDSEDVINTITEINKNVNIEKIYLDAYIQENFFNGSRYPEVNKAILQNVEKGSLFINYMGHGGVTGWAHEEILTIEEIKNMENTFNLPIFVTGTCSFAPYDNPSFVSAGELLLSNPKGGSIALFTTARATFGPPNLIFSQNFYKEVFNPEKIPFSRLGDFIKIAKQKSNINENSKKFVLLGDPAIKPAIPNLIVKTDSVLRNNTIPTDTIKAFDLIKIKGSIYDFNNVFLNNFDGIVTVTVYDKPSNITTLANDGGNKTSFQIQNNVIYNGKAEVKNGLFEIMFQVPKDISYSFGVGKISYYATNYIDDAWGSYFPVIGGESKNYTVDFNGPELKLFMNDNRFVDGGLTDPNPWLIAKVSDENGINTVGAGIGHEIIAVLDDKTSMPFILNNFYVSDVGTYKKGTIRFPFTNLSVGEHHIDVKIWDIYNNSTDARITFYVEDKNVFKVNRAFAFPNPFTNSTSIIFEHNQKNVTFETLINIYTLSGKLIKTINSSDFQFGSISTPIVWDGRNNNGVVMPGGVYFYVVQVKTSDGMINKTNGKLIKN